MNALTVYRPDSGQPLRNFLNPLHMARDLWAHRDLTMQLARREVLGRYRSARLGILWSGITPFFSLIVYTFVFSGIFKARFTDNPAEGYAHFALYLFCGMLVYNVFAEVAARAPSIITENPNYVKKVVFPLEVMVPAVLMGALFRMAVGFVAWLGFWTVLERVLPKPTLLLLPLVVLPLCLLTAGVAWLAAAVGVFVRDLAHAAGVVVQLLAFLTPVYYSIERIQQPLLRAAMQLNPLSQTLEQTRRVAIVGGAPDWGWWLASLTLSGAACLLGYASFMKSKRAFGDVL
ncbi:MAG: ABC transporter permease [Armatimonadetes bacterium]|nr:ABC transporter permease [Armatimonadota bacterium]